MKISKQDFTNYISDFDFRGLFIDMGWHNDKTKETVIIDQENYTLQSIAEMSGFRIFICTSAQGIVPNYKLRRSIENKINKLYSRTLIIFIDNEKTEQVWLLVTRSLNQRVKASEVSWSKGKSCELLYQRASGLVFEIDDEGKITIIDVTSLVSNVFNQNNEAVTKKFYERFRKEHDVFEEFISGISNHIDSDWYASLMLNRLMFCYFIQKRRFLNNDADYLKNKLKTCRETQGKDKFYSFYRNFLRTLFHQGFATPEHNEALVKEIGRVPYLNGGLFDVHELETTYTHIDIKDEAFEKLFAFFDQYQWTLDIRPGMKGDEINPDVIGYIFEKYINDRAQMGAYYTKEDITEYIAKNCVIPHLFDAIEKTWPHPFNRDGDMWRVMRDSGDTYIYDAVKHGADKKLPPEIEKGVTSVPERGEWNKTAPPEYALPTEIWREVIARRQRYFEVKEKIAVGNITHINDFITYNLNIRQFAQDSIEQSDDAAFVKAFWEALESITILDPTCGSGAFLFAALNILEPLYESCIMRMRGFVEDEDRENGRHKNQFSNKYKAFRETLEDIQNPKHPNQKYFIYKTIILNNLYGVDIMREAVEIAKLRLFLKLVAAVEADYRKPNLGLEPLPDIDFNIRSGNTLVGFATKAEIDKAFSGEFKFNKDELDAIYTSCETLASEFKHFQDVQLSEGADGYSAKKIKVVVQKHLNELREKLNGYMALVYGIDLKNKSAYDKWLATHQPFHWFAEFYQIIALNGGFDVVIGNPPYVTMSKINYDIKANSFSCSDIFGFVIKRVFDLLSKKSRYGFIVMHNLAFSRSFEMTRKTIRDNASNGWFSFYARIPAGLFSGDVRVRNCMFVLDKGQNDRHAKFHTTRIHRWFAESRETLFSKLNYSSFNFNDVIPMFNSQGLSDFFENTNYKCLSEYESKHSKHILYFKQSAYNWIAVSKKPAPCFDGNGKATPQTKVGSISFISDEKAKYSMLYLNGKLSFSFWLTYGDEFDVTKEDLLSMRVPFDKLTADDKSSLDELASEFSEELDHVIQYKLNAGKKVGTYNTSKLWHITDKSDMIFLKYMCNSPEKIFAKIEDHVFLTIMSGRGKLEGEE